MGVNSRQKGARGEREFAAELRARGIKARRGRQYSGGDDSPDVVTSLEGVHFEVKRVERFSLYPALEQATKDAAVKDIAMVAHKRNRKPWVVIMTLDDFIRLYAEAKNET